METIEFILMIFGFSVLVGIFEKLRNINGQLAAILEYVEHLWKKEGISVLDRELIKSWKEEKLNRE